MNPAVSSWRKLIACHFAYTGDTWADVVACTLDDAGLDATFDAGFGGVEGAPFTLWTTKRVYFPTSYGAEGVSSAPRNPCADLAAFADAWAQVVPDVRVAVAVDVAGYAAKCANALEERAVDAERAGLPHMARECHDLATVVALWQVLAMRLATAADAEAGPQPVFVEVPR